MISLTVVLFWVAAACLCVLAVVLVIFLRARNNTPGDHDESAKDKGAEQHAPSPSLPSLAPSCPRGPDGSGNCSTDEWPPVPNVPVSSDCKVSRQDVVDNTANTRRWASIPIFGDFITTLGTTSGNGALLDRVQEELMLATDEFQTANEQFLNVSAQVAREFMGVVEPLVDDVLGPGGLVELTGELAAARLSGRMLTLLPALVALLVITALLVWAV